MSIKLNINAIEIAYNRVEEYSIRALCQFFEKKQITSLKLKSTKTNATNTEILFESMRKYTKLSELKLQNF